MDRVFGPEELIQRVEDAKPGDPAVYVNMDAVRQLPDQYEAQITEVKFDPKKDFSDVGNSNWMPNPEIHAAIALARGIEGTDQAQYEAIIEEVDLNPMLCRPLEDPATMRKMKVGYVATKVGFVLNEDGTEHYSDPCTASYNVWDRCVIDWSKEEENTEGYSPKIVKNGQYKMKRGQKEWTAYVKYGTPWARKRHFNEEMKFAQRKADTKARHVVIRVLAGLKTGYKEADLKDGRFIFVRIRRSRESLQLEQAAKLEAMRKGLLPGSRAGQVLFGKPDASAEIDTGPAIREAVDPEPEPEDAQAPLDPLDKDIPFGDPEDELTLLDVLQAYHDGDLVTEDLKANTKNGIDYIVKAKDFGSQDKMWSGAIALLARIESHLDNEQLIEHEKWE